MSWIRRLCPDDFGVPEACIERLDGTIAFDGTSLLIRIDFLAGKLGTRIFGIERRLRELAKANGAGRVEVRATFANAELLKLLQARNRYNLESVGGSEVIWFEV